MKFAIDVKLRKNGNAEDLRSEGLVPGVVYGPDIKPISIAVDYNTFEKIHREAESNLIDLRVEGQENVFIVLVQDMQFDPVSRRISHIDFRQVPMNKPMHTEVVLNFIGESDAVKTLGGTLIKTMEIVDIKCLPKDLIGSIDVDLSALKTFDDTIHVKDIKLPTGVEILDSADTVIAKVSKPLSEAELEAMEKSETKTLESIEVVKAKKDEEGKEEASEENKKK